MMKKASVKQLQQEVRDLKSRLRLVEQQVNQLEVAPELSPEEEFRRAFPDAKIDPKWFKLVGALPPSPFQEDETELIRALEERYRS